MNKQKVGRPGTKIIARWPSGRTSHFSSVRALSKVLSGTGRLSGGLQRSINVSAASGTPVRGVYVRYV